jgi:amino acid adenylation domain-containing protein
MEGIPISPIQKHFWLLQKVYRNNTSYNIPVVVKFNGIPDLKALEYALNSLIQRHEALRVYFEEANGEVYARPVSQEKIYLTIEKTESGSPLTENILPPEIRDEVHRVFNLEVWPLMRVRLFTFAGENSILTIVFHHIITDLHSKEIFARDFSEFYNSFRGDSQPQINTLPADYSNYLRYEVAWLNSDEAEKMKAEWKNYIPQTPEILEVPSDFPRPRINTPDGKRKHFTLSHDLYARTLKFAEKYSVNLFTVMLSVYAILLYRLSGQNRTIIGVPLTNRRREEFRDTFGCFVNIVPVLVTIDDNITGSDLVKQIRYSLLRVHRMQEIPFLLLNELLKNDTGYPLFQAGFTFEPPVNLSLNNLEAEPMIIEKNGSQMDLFLTLWEEKNVLNGLMEYSTLLYRDRTARHFIDIYKRLLNSFLENPESTVSEFDMLSDEETRLIMEWNSTDHEYTDNICLHQKFEQQVHKTPDAPAIIYGDKTLSYSEFNTHANRMANYLIGHGVKTEDIVCVCMERSVELMIAIYGIHKAGAAYLPVDPDYPSERLGMILSDSRPRLILTNRRSEKNIPVASDRIYLDNILSSPLSQDEKTPVSNVTSHNLAYLMYTSGSTGVPKGVMIEHHSVVNKLEWMQFRHPLDQNDTIMLKTPVTFDVSVWELFWWMFNGAKMTILPPGGEKEPGIIIHEVFSNKVTTIVFVPSMFSPFVGYMKAKSLSNKLTSLKWIIQIGEALSPQLVNSFNEMLTPDFNPLMVNTYGPTEATVAVSWYDCPKEGEIEKIYIGKPIFNTKLLVLNKRNKIQPAGVPGELVITGVNLSRGYLNRPELNSERFITFRYPDGRYLRGYKTGDLVKWNNDGNIDFIGRTDSQVKIRGFRIELGEIEAKLLESPLVKTAAVTIRELKPENKFIAGYVVLKEPFTSSPEDLKSYLATKLPDYMIPGFIMILDDLPLNTSGKIDRKALPFPDFVSHAKLVAPSSSFEKKLLDIWKETLGLEDLSITHNFFDIGGNSILAVHMVNLLKKRFSINIEPLHVMEHPNIKSLSRFITENCINSIQDPPESDEPKDVRKQSFSAFQQRRNNLLRNTSESQ